MIYDTTFKNLVVHSIDTGGNDHSYTRLSNSLLVVYSGTMPTYEEFVTDWNSLYYVFTYNSGGYPIDPGNGFRGSNVLAAYGASTTNQTPVNLTGVNNEIYLDTTTPATSRKCEDGTPTFAMLITDTTTHVPSRLKNNNSIYPADWMENQPFMLLSVSDTTGDGIVKLSTLDTTLSSSAPTLMSIEFEVNMGE